MTEAGKLKLRVIPSQKRLRAEAIFAHIEERERTEALEELREGFSLAVAKCVCECEPPCGWISDDAYRASSLLDLLA